jgi:XTP/dITP diphosphohydrolase
MRQVIIATENLGKFREIKALLVDEFDAFYSLKDFEEKVIVEEESPLYVENAIKKARKIGDRFGFPTIADDSGLEVDALGGRPGVLSARYGRSDEERISRLLRELEGVPWERRKAVFKAYIVFYMPEKEQCHIFYGRLTGIIGPTRQGTGGFGFDPIFYATELGRYLAELSVEEKNRLSHRGRALYALKAFLQIDAQRSPRALNQ